MGFNKIIVFQQVLGAHLINKIRVKTIMNIYIKAFWLKLLGVMFWKQVTKLIFFCHIVLCGFHVYSYAFIIMPSERNIRTFDG